MLASEYWRNPCAETHSQHVKHLERAVGLDPNYAGAWAMLSILYGDELRFGFPSDNDQPPLDRALTAAKKAIENDPMDASGHHALFMTHFNRNELSAFEAAAKRALSLNPNYPDMLADYGMCTALSGQYQKGLEYLNKASRSQPRPARLVQVQYRGCSLPNERIRQSACRHRRGNTSAQGIWGESARAMLHGQLGNKVRGERMHGPASRAQFRRFPRLRAMRLVSGILQEHDIDHMMDGWEKAGMAVPA